MNNETRNIKDHICPSCGGTLRVDVARQMYECPFCGMTFDYDYFREENVLELADKALTAGEAYSARQAYEFMLTKEPDNFVALRGLSLISMKLTGIEEMRRIDSYRKVVPEMAYNALDNAIEASKPENKEYFVLMEDMLDAGNEYYDEEKAIEATRKELSEAAVELKKKTMERDDLNKGEADTKNDPKSVMSVCTACLVFWVIISTVIFASIHFNNPYSKEHYKSVSATMETTQYNQYAHMSPDEIREYNATYYGEDTDGKIVHYYAPINVSDRRAAEQEQLDEIRAAQRAEEKERADKEEEWIKAHKSDIPMYIVSILIPAAVLGIIAVRLKKRDSKYAREIAEICKVIADRSAEIKLHQENQSKLRGRIETDYKALRDFEVVI